MILQTMDWNWQFPNCRPRIDARTLRALYFAWDKSDEAEQNWTSIVEETHPDVKALKKKFSKKNVRVTTSSPAEISPVKRLRQQVYSNILWNNKTWCFQCYFSVYTVVRWYLVVTVQSVPELNISCQTIKPNL